MPYGIIPKKKNTEEKEDKSEYKQSINPRIWVAIWRNFVIRHRNNNAMGPGTPLWLMYAEHNLEMNGPSFEKIMEEYYQQHPGKKIMDDQKRAAKLRQAERKAKEQKKN